MTTLKLIAACIISWLLGVLCALAFSSHAGHSAAELARFSQEYAAGTLWADREDYAELYRRSTERSIAFAEVREFADLIAAEFETSMMLSDGTRVARQGGVVLHLRDGAIEHIEWAYGRKAEAPPALAGQLADVATTAAGLAAGLSEANPAVASLTATPGGWAVLIAGKMWLAQAGRSMGYLGCVEYTRTAGGMGWAFAGWNAGLLAHPVAAIGLAIVGWTQGADASREDAAYRCLPDADETKAAGVPLRAGGSMATLLMVWSLSAS